jgi:hypothetical protein
MHEKFLDLKISIQAEEAVLADIYSKLADDTCAELATALSELVRQSLLDVDVADDFHVDLQCSSIKRHYATGGGLHADTWMETRTESSEAIDIQALVHGHED